MYICFPRSPPLVRVLTAASLLVIACIASAQDFTSQSFLKQGDEILMLNLGGILNLFGTTVKLNGPGLDGSNIDLENSGLQKTLSSFDAGGTWRFWSRNRVDVLYFSASRSGSRTINQDLNIDGVTVPVNSTLMARTKDQFLDVDYRYSFFKADWVELAGLAGLYGGQYKYQLAASRPLSGAGQAPLLDVTASTTVPLPLLGATVDWYVNSRWKLSASASGMKAHIGIVDGSAFIGGINTEFMLVRNFGIGLGYLFSNISADVSKSSFNGSLGSTMNSASLYGQFKF